MKEAIKIKRITARHLAPISRLINNIGVKEVSACFNQPEFKNALENGGESAEKLGVAIAIDILAVISAHYESCQDDLFSFMSDLTGITAEEVAELPIDEFTDVFIQIVTAEDFKRAFGQASRLLK